MLRKFQLNHIPYASSWLPSVRGRWPIRIQLLCLVLAVALPYIGLVVFTEYDQARIAVNSAGNSTLNLAEIAAGSTEQFLLDSKALLAQLAPAALPYVVDSEICNSFQREFRNLPAQYANLFVVDLSGRTLYSTAQPLAGYPEVVADRQWFQNVLRDNKFTVSEPLIGRSTGKWSVALGFPLDDDQGRVVGVLALAIDLVRYQFVLDAVTLVPGSAITIVDDAGTIIARSPQPESLVGKDVRSTEIVDTVLSQASGQAQAPGIDGLDRIYGFTTIEADRWHVYAGIPTDAVLADVRAGLLRNGLLALAITLAVLAGAFLISRHITQPIRALAVTARAVAGGIFQARAPIGGPVEVAQVAAEFNEMLDARLQDERALRDSEARLRLVINQLPMLLWTTDTDLRFTSNLGKGFQSRNLQPNQLVGQSVLEILHTTDPQFPAIQSHRQALQGQSRAYELAWAGRIYEAYVEPLLDDQAQIFGCIGVALDVTERKRAEETLRRSEARFRALIENSLDAILLYSADGTTLYASPSISRINGYSAQEIVGQNRFEWIHPDEMEQVRAEWSGLLEQPDRIVRGQARGRHKDGSWLWIERVLHNLLADSSVGAIVVNIRDITERKRAEQALQDSEAKFRGMFETVHSIILMTDRHGIILDINSYVEQALGYSPSELRGRNVFDGLYVAEDRPKMQQVIQDLTEGHNREYEVRWIAKNGRIVTFAGSSTSRFRPDGEFISTLCALVDITERKRAEEALQRYTLRLETLHTIDLAILAARSLDEIADAVLHRVMGILACQEAHVSLFDLETREIIIYAARSTGESSLASGIHVPFDDMGAVLDGHLDALRGGRVLIFDDITTLPDLTVTQNRLLQGLPSGISAPLRVRGELIGSLNLWADQPARFGPDDADTVRDVADSLAVAINQVELFEEVTAGREQMRQLAARIVSTQEQERRHIANELHDEIGQNLTAVKITLDLLDQLPDDLARIKLTEAAQLVDDLLNRIRNLSLDLRPAMLDDLGLLPTLQSYFERYTRQMAIQVLFKHNALDSRFAAAVESAAYRIVQEALTNVARHAKVSEVTVRLWVDQDTLNVQIEDHGVGFDRNAAFAATDKSGLSGMRERATLLGGQLSVESSPGTGTRLTAELPVQR